jgi:glycosyltransferase involved in cell wall biosynthesis
MRLIRIIGVGISRILRVKQIRGCLDSPIAQTGVRNGVVSVVGWAHFSDSQVSTVEVLINDESVGFAQLGFRRTDVAKALLSSSAEYSGFTGVFRTSSHADEPTLLVRVRATSVGGRVWTSEAVVVNNKVSRPVKPGASAELIEKFRSDPRPKVLVFTHQLDLGGGQLWLSELMKQVVTTEKFAMAVSAEVDGALRSTLEDSGIPVLINPIGPDLMTENSCVVRIDQLVMIAKEMRVDLVLVNTLGEFFGVGVAKSLGKPAIWCIHESYSPAVWREFAWPGQYMADAVYEQFLSAIYSADALVFEARETAELFAEASGPKNRYLLDYGINLQEIDDYREMNSREKLRKQHDVKDDETVLVVLGVFSERKAQAVIINAFRNVPSKQKVKLFLVGAIDTDYTRSIRKMVEDLGLASRVILVPLVEDYYEYLLLADVLLSASNVESLPRSMLEAMSFGLPVLSTAVFGVNSLIDSGIDGWLVEVNNLKSLTEALIQVSSLPHADIRTMGERARKKMVLRHQGASYGEKMGQAMLALIEGRPSEVGTHLQPIGE